MKIIGLPDYYDHMIKKYGFDTTRVLDRRPSRNVFDDCFIFAIAGKKYPFARINGKMYNEFNRHEYEGDSYKIDKLDRINRNTKWGQPTNVNSILRRPVVSYNGSEKNPEFEFVPILKEFGFAKWLDAETVYREIYDFLGWLIDNPEIPDKMTDREKVVSHGFDLKKSFRHRKKD